MSESEKKSYYAIIPANVRYDKNLNANAKLLYGEITALCNERGYCWASNSYFAELYGVANETVSRWIKKLCDYGYVSLQHDYDGKNITGRKIFIVDQATLTKTSRPLDKKIKTPCQKRQDPLTKRSKLIIH